uniref:phosphoribosylaminoimidazolesuccinocarboxamide synthase n=1 Tax=Alistipes sp. TaxID=1872444 RepID=UPI00405795FC
MQLLEMCYEGKGKQLFLTDDPNRVVIRYKDDAAAFHNVKKAKIIDKGRVANAISSLLFNRLNQAGVKTHFLERIGECDQLCRRVEIFPLEVVVRNVIAGSMAERLGIEEGTRPENVIYDLCLKNDLLGDPLLNDHRAVAMGLISYEQLREIYAVTERVNEILRSTFDQIGVELVDFKIEFGLSSEGELLLADEISPDTCRLWDRATGDKLDKDRFRRDLGRVREAYEEVLRRLETL